MMMMMMNCFCGMVDRLKAFSLIYKLTIFLRLSLIKPNELLDVLNNLNPAITMETSDTHLPFVNIMINKDGKKGFDGYLFKTNGLKYVSFKSNQPKHFLKNFLFSLASRIGMITEKIPQNKLN